MMRDPKKLTIDAVCPTYLRPELLGASINCFLKQTHERRRLIILDDAGQYEQQRGDRWELVSRSERYPSLGAKRNALAAMALADPAVDGLAVMDDDDYYFPHWLDAIADALTRGAWCQASKTYVEGGEGRLVLSPFRNFHGAWGISRRAWEAVGGYDNTLSRGEDIDMRSRLSTECGLPVDTTPPGGMEPYYIFAPHYPGIDVQHIGRLDIDTGYQSLVGCPAGKAQLHIGPLRDFSTALPELVKQAPCVT